MTHDPMSDSVRRDFRTPVGRARGWGSAKSGTGHFWWQRVTAVLLLPLIAWVLGMLISLVGADLETARMAVAKPWNAIMLALLVLSMFWHAKLGLQVIIEDYVHHRAMEIGLQLLVILICAIGVIAALYAIARIAVLG